PLGGHLGQRAGRQRRGATGGVDHGVDVRPGCLRGLGHRPLDLVGLGQVGGDRVQLRARDLGPDRRDRSGQRVRPAAEHDDRPAVPGQRGRRGPADPGAPAGHVRDPGHLPSFPRRSARHHPAPRGQRTSGGRQPTGTSTGGCSASATTRRRGRTTSATTAPAAAPAVPATMAIDIASVNASRAAATNAGPRARVSAIEFRAASGTASGSDAVYFAASTLPSTATDSAVPVCCTVSFIAEPTPRCSAGTDCMSSVYAGGPAMPPPMPSTSSPATSIPYPEAGVSWVSSPNAPATTSSPTTISVRSGIFLPSVAPRVLNSAAATAYGSSARPASSASYPRTNCRYWLSTSSRPPAVNESSTIEKLVPLKSRLRNRASGTIGCSQRRSHSANAVSATAPTTSPPSTCAEPKPCAGSEMIAHTSAVIPTIDSRAPAGSAGLAGPRDSGISASAATMPTTAIGTLMRKIEPHQKWSSRKPPTVGPATTPIIATMLQPAIALRCSCGGNTVNTIDSVLGMSSAPPTPMSARQAMSWPGLAAIVASSEPAPKTASPTSSARRRP